MRDAVIVEAVRTPVGNRNGGLSVVAPADLSSMVLNTLAERGGTAVPSRHRIHSEGSGARITTTLIYHMRDNNIRYGLQTVCEGGGQANATILELI